MVEPQGLVLKQKADPYDSRMFYLLVLLENGTPPTKRSLLTGLLLLRKAFFLDCSKSTLPARWLWSPSDVSQSVRIGLEHPSLYQLINPWLISVIL